MGKLHRLVADSRHEEVRVALENGADVNEVFDNWTPLDTAINNNDVAMVDILIQAGANVNHEHPKTGKRPLHDAVNRSDFRILDLLLKAGADVEGCKETSTPLCIAAAFGYQEAYDRLLKAGANPNATRGGKTASEILATSIKANEIIMARLENDTRSRKPDEFEPHIRKMMEEYPTVEEFAAHRGRNIYFYGLHQGIFTDPVVGKWAQDLEEILRDPERLRQCEEQFLSGTELEKASRERKRLQRQLERDQERANRIASAAESFSKEP